jgi:hypothetical protein
VIVTIVVEIAKPLDLDAATVAAFMLVRSAGVILTVLFVAVVAAIVVAVASPPGNDAPTRVGAGKLVGQAGLRGTILLVAHVTAIVVLVANPRARDASAARFALELFGEIAGRILEHAGAVGEDLSFLRAETSFAAEIVVTQLAPEAVGAQTSPVMRQLEHRMTKVVDVAPSEVLSVSRSSWGTAGLRHADAEPGALRQAPVVASIVTRL